MLSWSVICLRLIVYGGSVWMNQETETEKEREKRKQKALFSGEDASRTLQANDHQNWPPPPPLFLSKILDSKLVAPFYVLAPPNFRPWLHPCDQSIPTAYSRPGKRLKKICVKCILSNHDALLYCPCAKNGYTNKENPC